MLSNDTIAALATPPGTSSIAVIRVSGDKAIETVNKIFSKDIKNAPTHTVHLGKILGKSGMFTNEILAQKAQSVKSTPVKRKASGIHRRLIDILASLSQFSF